jgi:hypothetical protein
LSPSKLYRSHRICEDHFRKDDILPSGHLMWNACPIRYVSESSAAGPSCAPSTSGALTPTETPRQLLSPSPSVGTFPGSATTADTSTTTTTPPRQHPTPIVQLSPTPKLFKSRESPRTYSKLPPARSSPAQAWTGFPSPAVVTPSSTFWIDNARDETPSRPERVKRSLFRKDRSDEKTKKVTELKKKLAVKRVAVTKIRTQLKRIKKREETNLVIPAKSQDGRILMNMQFHKKRQPWRRDEKFVATSLYLRSPSVYEYLFKSLILPGISTIKSWISNKECFKTGFNNRLMSQLKMKVSTMKEDQKACTIMFDEMSIKEGLEYSAQYDLIEGFQDIGCFGRSPIVGKEACVFMARGLYSQWKMPVGYFISGNGIKAHQTKSLIKDSVEKLQEIGLCVKAVVCDQNSTNRSAFSQLGVSQNRPYFLDSKEQKIHALFDVPHLLKSIRNNLLTHNFSFENKTISFNDVKKLFELDSNSTTTRAVPKLSPAHIKPSNFQKMNVALAAQVLSHSVAAGLRTAVATKQITTDTALHTADFLEKLNSIFDALNSRTKISANPDKCALTRDHPHIIKLLEDAAVMFSKLEKMDARVKRPPCFDGVRLTVAAVLSLVNQEKGKYILTTRLNQDPIENLFSSIRQRGGWNRNPTVRIFRSALRLYALKYIIEPPATTSYDADYDTVLDIQSTALNVAEKLPSQEVPMMVSDEETTTTDEGSNEGLQDDPPECLDILEPVTLESCSQAYYAGYLAHRTFKKFKCEQCKQRQCDNVSTLDNADEKLLLEKTFSNISISSLSGLKAPHPLFFQMVKSSLSVYGKIFKKICHKQRIMYRLLKATKNRIERLGITYSVDKGCEGHEKYTQETLFRVLLHKQCKWISASHKNTSINKIRILHNV